MASKLLLLNPKKRRTTKKSAAKSKVRTIIKHVKAAVPKRRKRRAAPTIVVKSNPKRRRAKAAAGLSKDLMKTAIMPSVVSTAGALGLDVAMGYINAQLPPEMQSGVANSAVRAAGAIGLGLLGTKLKGKAFGEQLMIGGLTITLYNAAKPLLQSYMPEIPLAGVGVYDGSMGVYSDSLGVYSNSSMGNMGVNALGYYNPALSSRALANSGAY